MLNSVIQEALAEYDRNKGAFRVMRDESHLAELREFAAKTLKINSKEPVPDTKKRSLSAPELLELVKILLKKKKRDKGETATIFTKLAEHFGGYDALNLLERCDNTLNEDYVVFLLNNKGNGLSLVSCLVGLPYTKEEITAFMSATKILSSTDKLLFFTDVFDKHRNAQSGIMPRVGLSEYIKLLQFLAKHSLEITGLGSLLVKATKISSILPILKFIEEYQTLQRKKEQSIVNLLTSPTVARILALANPEEFLRILKVMPISTLNLDLVLTADSKLNIPWYDQIIINFNERKWSVDPYLKRILETGEFGLSITKATDIFKKLTLPNEFTIKILDALFAHPEQSESFMEALQLLVNTNKKGFQGKDLDFVMSSPQYPLKMAKALMILRVEGLDNTLHTEIVRKYPEFAIEIAHFEVELSKLDKGVVKYAWRDILDAGLTAPHSVAYLTPVVRFWTEHQLSAVGLLAIAKVQLPSPAFFNVLHLLKKGNMLTMPVLDLIIPKMKYIRSIASAINCLAQAGKLDKNNLDLVLAEPNFALRVARHLEGKPTSNNKPPVIDAGVKHLNQIRMTAAVLAQGQRQHSFFAPVRDVGDFQQRTNKRIEQAQKEILITIAQYSASQAVLEPDVQYREVAEAFDRPRPTAKR